MRTSVIYGCLGLVSISSLAGCGLFSSSRDDCACNSRPVARNGVVVQAPNGTTATATISGASSPIAAPRPTVASGMLPEPEKPLPNPTLPAIPAPVPSKAVLAAQSEPERKVALAPETTQRVEPSASPRPEIPKNDPRTKEWNIALKSEPIQSGHAEDFKTITGQVQMWRNTVRLRYAPIDQEDRCGGFVVLEGDAELTKLRDGQHVRIRGVLIAPENRNAAAHYRVQGLDILD